MNLDHIAVDLRPLAVPIEALNPMPNNARRHVLDHDVAVLASSFRGYRQRKAFVGKRLYRGVPNAVIAGNGSLLAARQLGWTHVAVSWCRDDEPDDVSQAYALTDNRTAELSQWDFEELSAQLADLADLDPGMPAALGWSESEAGPLLSAEWQVPDREPLPTDVPEPPATVIFNAAQHRVRCEGAADRGRRASHRGEVLGTRVR